MPTLTYDQLANLPFGYLSGQDLQQWCSQQLLINQYIKFQPSLQNGCNQAYTQVANRLRTRYDVDTELQKIAFTYATATATVTGGAITAINITYAGTNYATAPTVTITGQGINATAEAVVTNGVVTAINITDPGMGYTSATVTLSGGAATDTRDQDFVMVLSICAVRNILGNLANEDPKMKAQWDWAIQQIDEARLGQGNFKLQKPPLQNSSDLLSTVNSPITLAHSSFRTLG